MKKLFIWGVMTFFGIIISLNGYTQTLNIENKTPYCVMVSGIVGARVTKTLLKPNVGKSILDSSKNSIVHLMVIIPGNRNYYDNILLREHYNKLSVISLYKKEKIRYSKHQIILE